MIWLTWSLLLRHNIISHLHKKSTNTNMTQHKRKRKRSPPRSSREKIIETNKILCAIVTAMFALIGFCAYYYLMLHIHITRHTHDKSEIAKNRVPKKRRSWDEEETRFSNRMYYRLFQMKRKTFQKLCANINHYNGEEEFKSEHYLKKLDQQGTTTAKGRMYQARKKQNGLDISGEWKLAITIRLLAGGSYLDMFLWSNVSMSHVTHIFHYTTQHWLCRDYVSNMNYFDRVLLNKDECDRIRRQFGPTSDGVMIGVIGAIDGWLVRIRCPTLHEVPNPGKFM